MTNKEIRRRNFIRLLHQLGGNREAMCDLMGWKTVSLVARIVSTSDNPKTRKPIGDKMARQLEQVFNKPEGWMDSLNISLQGFELGENFDLLPPDKQETVRNVVLMGLPQPTPPETFPAPIAAPEKRKRRK